MKILIAEDDPITSKMLEKNLRLWGYEVTTTEDGQNAWEHMQKDSPPGLIMLDWIMPGMDGIDLCRAIRGSDRLKSTYIILLTSKDSKKEIIAGLDAGADDYITKPFDPAELQVRIAAGKRMVELLNERQESINRQIDLWEQIDTLLHTIPSGILIIDAETHSIVDANPMAIMLIGAPLEQLVGRKCLDYICIGDEGRCPITDLGQKIDHSERVIRNVDGELIPIQKSVAKAQIDGHPYYIESFVDLTQLKRLEAEKIDQEKIKAAFETAGAVCHEMNQPLQAVSGYTELLMRNGDLDASLFNRIKQIKEQVDRMGDVTRKLTQITKYETKKYLDSNIVDLDKSAS